MNITLLKYPTDEDWALAKQCALVTIGKEMKTAPDMEWKHSILRARHSPMRPVSRIMGKEQRRTQVSFTGSQPTCGRLWR